MEHPGFIHLLLRGERCINESPENLDEYVREFRDRNLSASTIPVLKFAYKNVEKLAHLLRSIMLEDLDVTKGNFGLIITSPRVVDALSMAFKLLDLSERGQIARRFDSDLVFTVGQKSFDQCDKQLGIKPNSVSSQAGNSRNLAQVIKTFCHNHRKSPINLICPKGSKSDTIIEEALAEEGFQKYLHIHPIEVYDTLPSNEVFSDAVEALERLNLSRPVEKKHLVVINLIFFSPSGLEAFLMIDRIRFAKRIDDMFNGCQVELKYSSIGKTTEAALRKNGFNVFCVAEKPNPGSLVDSVLSSSLVCDN